MSNYLKVKDNSTNPISSTDKESLEKLSGYTLQELSKIYPDIFVWPSNIEKQDDGLEDKPIYTIKYSRRGEDKIYELITNNAMGFLGVDDCMCSIMSRFSPENSEASDDYFMHYMLMKVFNVNIVDLASEFSNEKGFDMLVWLFPPFLRKALSQGLYKAYIQRNYNDANVHGVIDINRHISRNNPFKGEVAYHTREHSHDNDITQLIRHTIAAIQRRAYGYSLLNSSKDTISDVQTILLCTPTYSEFKRRQVIGDNLTPVHHPYYTAYYDLQQLCLKILRYEEIKFQPKTDQNIYGVLFDGAWLWEAYLNTLLIKKDFKHPDNIAKTDAIYLFQKKKNPRYPDFYKQQESSTVILDAKYKRLDYGLGRDDIHQMLSYMYVLKANGDQIEQEEHKGVAALLYPCNNPKINTDEHNINGYGGKFVSMPFRIPSANDFETFISRMKESEQGFMASIDEL